MLIEMESIFLSKFMQLCRGFREHLIYEFQSISKPLLDDFLKVY